MPYREFTRLLTVSLESDPRVLGLVALGSMAEVHHLPDAFSDHDFFVITEEAAAFRPTRDWLPRPERIALWFQETPHGCKAVYDDGHLIEYAVFTLEELEVARVNDYRVLIDRERIGERMAALAERRDPAPSAEWLHGMFLSHVLVASARAQRGEVFSARWMLAHAFRFLTQLLGGGGDDLDPLRRFEHYALDQALRLGPASAAREMLAIYERECSGDPRAIAAVRKVV